MGFNDQLPTTGVGIKKPNFIEHISDEEFQYRIKSIAHAKRDIAWWAENFFHIVTLDKGLQKIKLYEKQKELLKHMLDNDKSIILSARQTGKCVYGNTIVKIRNKKTNKEFEISIYDLYQLIVNNNTSS